MELGSERAREVAEARAVGDLPIPKMIARSLLRRGCATLADVVDLDPRRFDDLLAGVSCPELERLYNLYSDDPSGFVGLLDSGPGVRAGSATPAVSEPTSSEPEPPTSSRPGTSVSARMRQAPAAQARPELGRRGQTVRPAAARHRTGRHFPSGAPPVPVDAECWRRLRDFERRARSALDLLDDHSAEALVVECFPTLGLSLGQAVEDMVELWSRNAARPMEALRTCRRHFPDAFLVVCEQIAQECYNGRDLWGGMTERLSCGDNQKAEAEIKNLLMERIRLRRLPVYESGDEAQPYINTVLLHAGLSAFVWKDIWNDLLLPVVRSDARGSGGERYRDGRELLAEATRPAGSFSVRGRRTHKLLSHTPPVMLAPLLESGLAAARQLPDRGSPDSLALLSEGGLPEAAIEGLSSVLRESAGDGAARGHRRGRSGEVVYLPDPELRLDLSDPDHPFVLHWHEKRLPHRAVGLGVEFYVNGELRETSSLSDRVHYAALESVDVSLAPEEALSVEIHLLDAAAEGGEGAGKVLATRSSRFSHSYPMTYEFLRSADDVWRLRKPGRQIRRREQIAYVVLGGCTLRPLGGMEVVNKETLTFGDRVVQVVTCDVSPGFSAELLSGSGEVLASWHDSFSVSMSRSDRIGTTGTGCDVYPVVLDEDGFNTALPEIVISSPESGIDEDDLSVICMCDGRRVSLKQERPYVGGGGTAERGPSSIRLLLSQSSLPGFVREGSVRVSLRSEGRKVLDYRFSVVPVRSFRLADVRLGSGDLEATYRLVPQAELSVTKGTWRGRLDPSEQLVLPSSLSRREMRVPLGVPGLEPVDVALHLAGISIDIGGLLGVAQDGCIDLGRLVGRGLSKELVKVEAARSYGERGIFVTLGQVPLLYSSEQLPSVRVIHGADVAEMLREGSYGGRTEDCPLQMVVTFGAGGRGEAIPLELASLRTGFGIGEMRLDQSGEDWRLRFGGEPSCPLSYSFGTLSEVESSGDLEYPELRGMRFKPRTDEETLLETGQNEIAIPRATRSALRRGRSEFVRFSPRRRFGAPDTRHSIFVDLSSLLADDDKEANEP